MGYLREAGSGAVATAPDAWFGAGATAGSGAIVLRHRGGNAFATLRGHRGGVKHLQVTADAERLRSTSLDGTVRLWRAVQPAFPIHLGGLNPMRGAAWIDDEHTVGINGKYLAVWSGSGLPQRDFHAKGDRNVRSRIAVAPSPHPLVADGHRLIATSTNHVRLWDFDPGRDDMLREVEIDHGLPTMKPLAIAFAPDGSLAVGSAQGGLLRCRPDARGIHWARDAAHKTGVYGVACSRDGRIASCGPGP